MPGIAVQSLSNYITLEPKIGIGRDDATRGTGGDAEGLLYRVGMQRLEGKQVGSKLEIIVEFEGLEDFEDKGFLRLGGEGKAANYETTTAYKQLDLSERLNDDSQLKLYIATPTIFSNGWCPDWLALGNLKGIEVSLDTCALGKPQYIGGFDLEKQKPKKMYKAIPAGSVYYLKTNDVKALCKA